MFISRAPLCISLHMTSCEKIFTQQKLRAMGYRMGEREDSSQFILALRKRRDYSWKEKYQVMRLRW
jgi:hypothetical protein